MEAWNVWLSCAYHKVAWNFVWVAECWCELWIRQDICLGRLNWWCDGNVLLLDQTVAISTLPRCVLQAAATSILRCCSADVAAESNHVAWIRLCSISFKSSRRRSNGSCPVVVSFKNVSLGVQIDTENVLNEFVFKSIRGLGERDRWSRRH